jgi:hypothetical protein
MEYLRQLGDLSESIQAIPDLITTLIVFVGLQIVATAAAGGYIAYQLGQLVKASTPPPAPRPTTTGQYVTPFPQYGPQQPRQLP